MPSTNKQKCGALNVNSPCVSPWNELLQKQTTADDKCEQKILQVQEAQLVLNIDSVLLSMLCPAQFGSSLQLLKKGRLHKLTTHQQTHAAPLFITLHSDPVKWLKPWQSSSARRAKGDSSHSRSSPLCSDNRNHISETESKNKQTQSTLVVRNCNAMEGENVFACFKTLASIRGAQTNGTLFCCRLPTRKNIRKVHSFSSRNTDDVISLKHHSSARAGCGSMLATALQQTALGGLRKTDS